MVVDIAPIDLYAPKSIPDIAELKKMSKEERKTKCHRAMNAGNFSPTVCRDDCQMWNKILGKCAERMLVDMESKLAYREIMSEDDF